MREFRICWAASSNCSLNGSTDWTPWDNRQYHYAPGQSDDDIAAALAKSSEPCAFSGIDLALGAARFEWWTEVRWNDD